MRKWLIGSGVVGALAAVVLVGGLVTGAFAQGPTPPAPSPATITEDAGDLDDVQEEFESQADDALEASHAEDMPGQ